MRKWTWRTEGGESRHRSPGAACPGKINFLISVRYSTHCTKNIMQPCSSLFEVIAEKVERGLGLGSPEQVDGRLMQSTAAHTGTHTHTCSDLCLFIEPLKCCAYANLCYICTLHIVLEYNKCFMNDFKICRGLHSGIKGP